MKNLLAIGLIVISFGILAGCGPADDNVDVPVMKPTDPNYAPPGVQSSSVGAAGGPAPAAAGGAQAPATQ
jgi:hypothetical protein